MRANTPIRGAVVLLAALAPAAALHAQKLQARWDGARVHVSAPQAQILTGQALERLHNGATVAFDFELTLRSGAVSRDASERFVISYDLWEERFSVTRLAREGSQPASATQLTADAAAAWCLQNISLGTEGIAPGARVRLRLDIRAEEPRDSDVLLGEDGISLTVLVNILSKSSRIQQQNWTLESGPLRLTELRPAKPN